MIGLNDPVVYAPQIVGIVFCTIQCCLAFMYPRHLTRNFSVKLPVDHTIDDVDMELGTPESADIDDDKNYNDDSKKEIIAVEVIAL